MNVELVRLKVPKSKETKVKIKVVKHSDTVLKVR